MSRIEELLEALHTGAATREELAELKRRLATPEGRAEARKHLWIESALHSAFHAEPVLAVLARERRPTRSGALTPWLAAHLRPHWWAMAAAVLLLLAGAAAWQWRSPRAGGATLSVAEGGARESVHLTRGERTWPVASQSAIAPGDVIEVHSEASGAHLRLDGAKTTLAIRPGAKLRVVSLTPRKHFALDRGDLRAEVARQPAGAPMLIKTPTAEALVLGTVFSLAAQRDQTDLAVEHGAVRLVQDDGAAETVKAGQSAVATLGFPVALVQTATNAKPAAARELQAWIKATATWSEAGIAALDFADARQRKWALCPGATLGPDGVLRLDFAEGANPYKAVGPQVPARPGEKLTLTGLIRCESQARLRVNYYQRDGDRHCFGFARVPGAFTTEGDAAFEPFEFHFEVTGSDELRFIAPILYLFHADGTPPREGDAIELKDLTLKRG